MGVETATFISQLSATNPLATDPISEGDDQIRLVKDVLQKQYTTLGQSEQSKVLTADANGDVTIEDGAFDFDVASHDGTNGLLLGGTLVTATAAEINKIDGYTGTTAELNYNDVTTLGTVEASKAVTAAASTATVNFVDKILQRPTFKDYGETKVAMAAHAVDISLGNVQTYTLSGGQTLTFTNPSATGTSCSFTLIVTNGGSATLTWPTTVDWAGGTAPTLTSSGIDVIVFTSIDAGTIWYGFAAGLAMA
jgi:hypothetical protein